MKQPKILVVGSFVMDLIVGCERFPEEGETVIGTSFSTAAGGKGANQAVQAARLGAKVTMVGKVGDDDFGKRLIATAAEAGVDTSKVLVSRTQPSAVGNIQLETKNGQTNNRICVVPGANMDITLDDIAFLEEEIAEYDMVIIQFEIPMEINIAVAKFAAAKGVPLMVNAAPFAPVPEELLPYITYISPNEHEAGEMTGIKVTDLASAEAAVKKIVSTGIDNVIITLGSRGAVIGDGKEFVFSPAAKGVVSVDPTAAGDSFVGAFCTAICHGLSKEKAMEFANQTASVTVTGLGAMPSLPTLEQVRKIMIERGLAPEF
ncbi:MAG: ribokinase [Clostridia bacterium]|nr:ribokinase [Clostridia bacterium]